MPIYMYYKKSIIVWFFGIFALTSLPSSAMKRLREVEPTEQEKNVRKVIGNEMLPSEDGVMTLKKLPTDMKILFLHSYLQPLNIINLMGVDKDFLFLCQCFIKSPSFHNSFDHPDVKKKNNILDAKKQKILWLLKNDEIITSDRSYVKIWGSGGDPSGGNLKISGCIPGNGTVKDRHVEDGIAFAQRYGVVQFVINNCTEANLCDLSAIFKSAVKSLKIEKSFETGPVGNVLNRSNPLILESFEEFAALETLQVESGYQLSLTEKALPESLQSLEFSAASYVGDDKVGYFKNLTGQLRLERSKISDKGLKQIANLNPNLKKLLLSGCRNLTPAVLHQIAMPELHTLDLRNIDMRQLTGDALSKERFPSLKKVLFLGKIPSEDVLECLEEIGIEVDAKELLLSRRLY